MVPESVHDLGRRARVAARSLARASSLSRDDALRVAADLLVADEQAIMEANGLDVARAEREQMGPTGLDRLRLTGQRIEGMAEALRSIAALADPVGEVVEGWVRPNGLAVERVRAPLGVVGVIYENRPNVTSDVAGLCVKSANAAFLRGSSSALASNAAVTAVMRSAMSKVGLPEDAVLLVEDVRRETAVAFMQLRDCIDCLIPRGGPALVASLLEHATVPYVVDGDGNCHVYVDADADLAMAERIVVNAKMQRPGVCNAAETLLVHSAVADELLPRLAAALEGVRLLADPRARALLPGAEEATDADFAAEFLEPTMAVAVVDDLGLAIDHIDRYGTGHSEAIVTRSLFAADRFTTEVDAAVVLVNASTRFADGGELGLGAEVGVSTQKLHARGPMGLRALTSVKWVVRGQGQVRE